MFTFIVILILIICVLLTLVVLAQSSKGDGLTGSLGSPGGMGSVFGVRRASDFLMKATIGLAIAFGVLVLAANILFLPNKSATVGVVQSGPSPVVPVPGGGQSRPAQSAPAVQQPQQAPQQQPAPAPAK